MKALITLILMLVTTALVSVFGVIAFVLNVIRKIYRKESLTAYFLSITVSNDQHGGTILFGREDFTISSVLYELSEKQNELSEKQKKVAIVFKNMVDETAKVIANILFKVRFINKKEWLRQQTHCKSAYIRELEEFRLRGAKTSVAMLEFNELISYFEDDTYKQFHRYLDDGTVRAVGWCCDFHIVKDSKVYLSGKRGDGVIYDPSTKDFKIEGD